jgi:hypothetical protein
MKKTNNYEKNYLLFIKKEISKLKWNYLSVLLLLHINVSKIEFINKREINSPISNGTKFVK